MDGYSALRLLRKHVTERRAELMAKMPSGMEPKDYHTTCGRVRELDDTIQKLDEIMRMGADDAAE